MSDSIRMMDLASLSRTLEQMPALDPDHRALSERLAARAADKRLDEIHRDVVESRRPEEARVDDQPPGRNRRRAARRRPEPEADPASEPEAVPESDEGHLIDIRA